MRCSIFCRLLIFCLIISGAEGRDLIIGDEGRTSAAICVGVPAMPNVDENFERYWERQAAQDLARAIGLMCGAAPNILDRTTDINEALAQNESPVFVMGELALDTEPSLREALNRVKKKNPVLRADAIAVKRTGNRIYLAGSNDESHYHAAIWLLRELGCRWYLPTSIGECIPDVPTLTIGDVDHVYAPPFEFRRFWLSWNGSRADHGPFLHRNFMHNDYVPSGHALGHYVEELIPEGGSAANIPISDPRTAEHVADKIADKFTSGKHFNLGMDDGSYESDFEGDRELQAGLWDKYFDKPVLSDAFVIFYNRVAQILMERHPESKTMIGFLAYSNMTVPPQRNIIAERPLVAYLAPIDIDPIHGMDDPESPPRQEYREMMLRWAEVMQGRVVIYEYDQGMLVWRDIPNPSHQAFVQDVKHYRDAGIMGIDIESRGARATTFLNLHLRGQLMWDPEADVDAMIDEFYKKFYGPAAIPMASFWNAIFEAWDEAIVTEHEYFVAPAIYTPELMRNLAANITAAERAIAPLEARTDLGSNDTLYVQRMEMARYQWAVLDNYMRMVFAASTDCDYASAVKAGKAGLAARERMSDMNDTFTTYSRPNRPAVGMAENGPAWWPGEVSQYGDLAQLTGGAKGELVKVLPLEWAFHRDPNDTGLPRGWARNPADLSYWNAHKSDYNFRSRKDYPTTEWEVLRTDLYAQAQGIRHPDHQSYTGYMWYKTRVTLSKNETEGSMRIMFPGLFNECWLYINGEIAAHRGKRPLWWYTDYRFEWDVDLTDRLKEGENDITIRAHNPHHFGGIFRRPFLYRCVHPKTDTRQDL